MRAAAPPRPAGAGIGAREAAPGAGAPREETFLVRREAGPLAVLTVPFGVVEPEAFLRAIPVPSRGFWQRDGRWVAHAGVVAEIDPRGGDAAACREDPYGWTRREATRLFDAPWIGVEGGRRPALHGGFAFDPGGDGPRDEAVDFWEPFPAVRFVLPALELVADREGAALTVVERFPRGTAPDEAEERLERRARAVRERVEAEEERGAAAPAPAPPAATSVTRAMGRAAWRTGIERILGGIERGEVRKVVLSRPVDVTLPGVPDPTAILALLRAGNPSAHTFLLQFARDRFLIGAAPELLGSLERGRFRTMAVAGSIPRGADPESDEWLGRQLLSSRKNRVEQEIVVEDVLERLAPLLGESPPVPDPELLRLPRIQHLRTVLEAAAPPNLHILDFVAALHPTAAVCGAPRRRALALLHELESLGRGWYAGPVGWFDDAGEGEFAPALRSAAGRGPLLRLYAGAGVVEGSRPQAEWDETRVKLQTMLQALGVGRVP